MSSKAGIKPQREAREATPIGDAAVAARTGKSWREWFELLDKAGARNMPHKGIAKYVHEHFKVSGWWSQMVTVRYEQERGLRHRHETEEGFCATGSKTIAVNVGAVFHAWYDEKQRRRWLKDGEAVFRSATPKKYIHFDWMKGRSRLDVNFYPKDKARSQVAVDHRKLADAADSARMKFYWAENLERLKNLLEAQSPGRSIRRPLGIRRRNH